MEKRLRYSISTMESLSLASQTFQTSAATATTLIADFLKLPPAQPPRLDVQRLKHLEELADVLERGLSDAERVLEETLPLASFKDLKTQLSALQERYATCLRQWREEGGRELTPPVLWQRLQRTNKALRKLYQDVCDHIVFAEAEEEEAITLPPGKLEDLVRAAHQKEGREDPY